MVKIRETGFRLVKPHQLTCKSKLDFIPKEGFTVVVYAPFCFSQYFQILPWLF